MNIFLLDSDITLCAQYHVDKHCVKMILEYTQLLNNALIKHNISYEPVYRQTHKNHPASIWTAESYDNFDWLSSLAIELCGEYTHRYNKIHKCQSLIEFFRESDYKSKLPKCGMTDFKLCMPDLYKVDSAVESYRNYYRGDKTHIAKWSKRNVPDWWSR
ncbi:hypothetical protein UFOVP1290_450 [uncultured Caudovirales phage]|uniref:Uncharacterized protein n=1 Tax=uncultured Caudovirales phage TaxID=2100421 RepID=A0A6J5RHH6_9CAUD|nr:hypothetical protein UFOVP1290_450 [uncultured Caudovirales phage]